MVGADGQENIPHRDWIRVFKEVMEEVKEEMRQQGREDEFIGGKVCIHENVLAPYLTARTDYILHDQVHHPRRDELVHRRLHRLEEGVPRLDHRRVD